MESITFTALDISCDHCRTTIEREVGSLPGVQTVSVTIPAKRVDVTYDPARISIEKIVARLDDEGYPIAK